MSHVDWRRGFPRPRWSLRRGAPTSRQFALFALCTLLVAGSQEATAQIRRPRRGLQVTPVRDLRFGTVVPGVRTHVRPDQLLRAGLFVIRGQRNMSVRIDLVLPSVMASRAGDQFPILFGRSDGVASSGLFWRAGVPFDPHAPLITTLGRFGWLFVWLGGTVAPNRVQVRGRYTATITLTIANLGN